MGFSSKTIAVFAKAVNHSPATNIYVSWNGDTKTADWRFVWLEEGVINLSKETKNIKKTKFETTLRLSGPPAAIDAICVEAINLDDQVLMVLENIQAVPVY